MNILLQGCSFGLEHLGLGLEVFSQRFGIVSVSRQNISQDVSIVDFERLGHVSVYTVQLLGLGLVGLVLLGAFDCFWALRVFGWNAQWQVLAPPLKLRVTIYGGIEMCILILFFKPSFKKYPRMEEKNKEIVVTGVNTNPGGVPT